jgi:hypothetical protein
MRVKKPFSEANRFRGNLNQFIILDPGKRAFETHVNRRRQLDCIVFPGGADVREFLALKHIDLKIIVAPMIMP